MRDWIQKPTWQTSVCIDTPRDSVFTGLVSQRCEHGEVDDAPATKELENFRAAAAAGGQHIEQQGVAGGALQVLELHEAHDQVRLHLLEIPMADAEQLERQLHHRVHSHPQLACDEAPALRSKKAIERFHRHVLRLSGLHHSPTFRFKLSGPYKKEGNAQINYNIAKTLGGQPKARVPSLGETAAKHKLLEPARTAIRPTERTNA